MPTINRPAVTIVFGYQCWFCARKWSIPSEKPTHWVETTCAGLGKGECDVESSFWSGRSVSRVLTGDEE